jgi:hypothetical protein
MKSFVTGFVLSGLNGIYMFDPLNRATFPIVVLALIGVGGLGFFGGFAVIAITDWLKDIGFIDWIKRLINRGKNVTNPI